MERTTIIYDFDDQPIHVCGKFTFGQKGSTDQYGAPLEPDTDDEMEILWATDDDENDIILNPRQEEEALEALWGLV